MPAAVLIRERRPQDLPALSGLDTSYRTEHVLRLQREGDSFHWTEQSLDTPLVKRFELDLSGEPSLALVACVGDRVTAYAEAWLEVWNRRLRLEHLYVEGSCRGQGVGRALLDEVRRRAPALGARGLWLETQDVNPAAVRFYLANGFRLCGWDDSLYDPAGPAAEERALFFYQAC